MDFFDRQAEAKRRSGWLLAGFAAATGAVALAVAFVIALLAGALGTPEGALPTGEVNAAVFTLAAMGTAVFIGLAALWRLKDLARGGGPVAVALGGERVTGLENDRLRRRLHNVVEEMAIASGVPVPEVYVMEDEPGINAFAAGLSPADAAVAVTRGTLDRLTRDELQGVVAHEFSHILNGDMRMNARLMGYVFGLVAVNTAGRLMLRGLGSSRGRSGGRGGGAVAALALAGFAIMLLGAIGVLAARVLQAAVSRQRERLADAAAVQFTRNPTGLANALKRIAASPLASFVRSARKEEVGHMLFASGRRRLAGLLATHPPIAERIRALDPNWQPGDPAPPPPPEFTQERRPAPADAGDQAPGGLDPATIAALVGAVDLAMAERVLALVPDDLHRAVLEPEGAGLVALALLLDPREKLRNSQLAVLEARLGAPVADRVARSAGHLEELRPAIRLALLDLATPALRRLPAVRREDLQHLAQRMVELDGVISPREAVLAAALESRLSATEGGRAEPRGALALLAVCARAGQPDARAAAEAWAEGASALAAGGVRLPRPLPAYEDVAPAAGMTAASLAGGLAGMPEADRRALMEALAKVAAHDGRVGEAELAVLRAAAAAMAVPVPPVAASAGA